MTAERLEPTRSLPQAPRFDGSQPCNQFDVEVFTEDTFWRSAVEVCKTCPFIDPCAAYAFERPWIYGVWGGTTKAQRDRRRRRQRLQDRVQRPPEWYSDLPGHRPGPHAS